MLDSTGSHIHRNIPCFVCEKTELGYESYTPEYSHGGYKVEIGSCMAPHDRKITDIDGARFFELQKGDPDKNPIILAQEVSLSKSRHHYHYGGLLEPKFGERIGETVFVCHPCSKHYGDDLPRRVAVLAVRILNTNFLEVLARCFRNGLFPLNTPTLKQRFQKINSGSKLGLQEDLKEFTHDLEALNQTEEVAEVLAKSRRIQKAISAT